MHHDPPVSGHFAQHFAGDLFARADGPEFGQSIRIQQQGGPFLVFGAPDFQHRHGLVAEGDVPDFDAPAGRIHQFGEHVAGASGPLVVDAHDRIAIAHLDAGADDAVHLLFHFRVAALHGAEVELLLVLSLDHARCRAAADADAIRRAADLDHQHALPGLALLQVARHPAVRLRR